MSPDHLADAPERDRPDSFSDDQLVRHAQRELPYNTAAFEKLVKQYEPSVFRTCLRYLGDAQDAEEVSQDAFMRVFHALRRFEGRSAFRTWLFRIVTNECANRYRKRKTADKRRVEIQIRMLEDEPAVATPLDDRHTWAGPVGEAVLRLSEPDREILILRHVSELALQEIAEVLEIGLSAAKMRLYRAEDRLRAQYQEVGGVRRV